MRDIWRHQPGDYFCVSTKSPWKDHFFARDELRDVEEFVSKQRDKDLYFCPHGFNRKRRVKECAVTPTLLWADLDEVDPRRLELKPTIAICSSIGRYVGIWECDGPISEGLNRALTYHVGADRGGWDLTQVLRMPGTMNFKYSPAVRVKLLWDDGPDYRVRDVERAVQFDRRPQARVRRNAGPVASFDLRRVLAKYRKAGVRKYMGSCTEGKRSDVIYRIGRSLRELGASRDEISCVIGASGAWQSKWGDDPQRLVAEIDRIISKERL